MRRPPEAARAGLATWLLGPFRDELSQRLSKLAPRACNLKSVLVRPAAASRRERDPESMQLGMIGLGKMGGNMAERLRHRGGHKVVGFDFSAEEATKPN